MEKPSALDGFAKTAIAGGLGLLLMAALPGDNETMGFKAALGVPVYALIVIGVLGMSVRKLKGSPFSAVAKAFIGLAVGTVALFGTVLLVFAACLARGGLRF